MRSLPPAVTVSFEIVPVSRWKNVSGTNSDQKGQEAMKSPVAFIALAALAVGMAMAETIATSATLPAGGATWKYRAGVGASPAMKKLGTSKSVYC